LTSLTAPSEIPISTHRAAYLPADATSALISL